MTLFYDDLCYLETGVVIKVKVWQIVVFLIEFLHFFIAPSYFVNTKPPAYTTHCCQNMNTNQNQESYINLSSVRRLRGELQSPFY